MLWRIEPDRRESSVPIYEQIVAQVIFGVASGSLEAGALIPSVRDLAGRLTVHPNTVARAFQELERQGVVTARRGRGMEVSGRERLGTASPSRGRYMRTMARLLFDVELEALSSNE